MQLLFLVIKRVELVDEVMISLAQAGVRGGTCIDSVGMAKSISGAGSLAALGLLNSILKGVDSSQKGKTVFVAIDDVQVDDAIAAIKKVTGDLSAPNAGVLFTVPITYAEGIK